MANCPFLLSLCRELNNSELLCSFLGSRLTSDESISSLFDDAAIPFIAAEFYRLADSQLDQIPVSALYHILSHPSLIILSDTTLYSYILSRHSANPDYCTLFQFVRFEYVSADCICDFANFNPESIDRCLWAAIAARLSSPLLQSHTGVEFPLKENKSLDGIISYLIRKHGGNVHDKGIVTITSKSVYASDSIWSARNIGDVIDHCAFWSKNEPGQWICWDFHEMRVRPTHYTIESGSPRLKSWVIESSLDGENWTEIDRKADSTDFQRIRDTASFTVSNPSECRFIRLTHTANHSGNDYLAIMAFDFFGILLESHE
jgi:hypothetical protein